MKSDQRDGADDRQRTMIRSTRTSRPAAPCRARSAARRCRPPACRCPSSRSLRDSGFRYGGSKTNSFVMMIEAMPTGQVDVEDPAPAVVVGEPAAEHRTEDGRHHDAEAPEAHRLAAVAAGGKASSSTACESGCSAPPVAPCMMRKTHQHGQGRREAAQERGDREADDGQHEQPLAAEVVRQPAGHGQDDRVGHQVRRQRPRGFVDGGRQAARDVRQRHVHHRGVQHLHEGARTSPRRDDPRIDGWDGRRSVRRRSPRALTSYGRSA